MTDPTAPATNEPGSERQCSECGLTLPANTASGGCPRCLLLGVPDSGLDPEDDGAATLPTPGPRLTSSAPARAPIWQPPTAAELAEMLPQYQIERMLGRGGMGAVYAGRQTQLDRLVAIKILPPDLDGAGHDFTSRFKLEARSMARLKHPSIVTVYDFGQTPEGLLYFVMEFVEGMDVQAMIAQEGRLRSADAIAIAAHVCEALQYAHSNGIIHRDIKPANVIVGHDGHVRVADFGLVKVMNSALTSHVTMSGSVMGTPNYLAPESLILGMSVDHRVDIYAVGVMLYHMLTGRVPHGMFELPSLKVPGLDPRLDGIIARAMRENRDQRYQSAAELHSDLVNILTQPVPQTIPIPLQEEKSSPRAKQTVVRQQRSVPVPHEEYDDSEDDDYAAAHEMLRTTNSMNTTLLVLGCTALIILGALAFFLANRKTGDVYHTEQTITTSETHNSYFTQIIAAGLASASDLALIADIRPYADHFIGITKDPLTWERAQALARQAGAEILPIGDKADGTQAQLLAWLVTSYSSELSTSAWVSQGGEPRVLNGLEVTETINQETESKVILQWKKPNPQSAASPMPPAPPATAPKPVVPNISATPAPPSETLEWTSRDGRVIRATFVELSGEAVVIRREDGQLFTVPFSTLAPASVEQAMKLGRQAK